MYPRLSDSKAQVLDCSTVLTVTLMTKEDRGQAPNSDQKERTTRKGGLLDKAMLVFNLHG